MSQCPPAILKQQTKGRGQLYEEKHICNYRCIWPPGQRGGKKGLDVVLVHPSGIIGPYDYEHNNHLNQTIRDFLSGKLTTLVKGGYDFVDVRDVADGLLKALYEGGSSQTYILSGHYVSIEELIKLAAKASGRTPIHRVLRLGEKLKVKLADIRRIPQRQSLV